MVQRTVSIIGILVAVTLFLFGVFTEIPDKQISSYAFLENGYEEYVEGDAYNYIIEASLRGGQIAGGMAQRAIFVSSAAILLLLSVFSLAKNDQMRGVMHPTTTQINGGEQMNYLDDPDGKELIDESLPIL